MAFCLAAAGIAVHIAASTFTLSWTHTIERTEWREDWRVTQAGLIVDAARITSSGAGMEPPPDAALTEGYYVWRPRLPPLREVVLRRAPEAGDWMLCAAGGCATIGNRLGVDADPVTLSLPDATGGCAR